MHVIGYTYDAAIHCENCAEHRFGVALDYGDAKDSEGNEPHPIFTTDEPGSPHGNWCDDCGEEVGAPWCNGCDDCSFGYASKCLVPEHMGEARCRFCREDLDYCEAGNPSACEGARTWARITSVWYAYPGGYPIVYTATRKNQFHTEHATLCPACAKLAQYAKEPWAVQGDIHYEGPAIECDDCGYEIKSAYGDPDAEKGDAS